MTERLKVHDWKSCVPRKGTAGSNPALSAAQLTALECRNAKAVFARAENRCIMPADAMASTDGAVPACGLANAGP